MGLIRRTRGAEQDFEDIWNYLAEVADDETADRTVRAFDDKLELLSDLPGIGRPRDELRPRLRIFPVGKYLLFYRPIRGGIELLRVIHGAMDIQRELRRRK